MQKILHNTLLYDFYAELLTERQKEIYHMYFCDDMSLAEVAGKSDVSRQAIHSSLKHTQKILEDFEGKLGLVARHNAAMVQVEALRDALDDGNISQGKQILGQLEQLI